jgi:sulfonate transport system substrate-binding protein
MHSVFSVARRAALLATALFFATAQFLVIAPRAVQAADAVKTLTLDWAYYNPVSLVLKEKGWVEQEFSKDGITVRWVQSLGSNKAIEFLNARSIQFGSTAGAAALLAKISGNPIKAVYIYSKPEWTALVTTKNSPIHKVEDLRGKRVAVTRGTDPYIFLVRALARYGMTEKDIKPVLLQHQDGRTALEKGDVDAWAGLDPMMAQTEVEQGSRLFYRNADANTYGFLNVPEDFVKEHPEIVRRVIAQYERARKYCLANPGELKKTLENEAKLTDAVASKQLERTDLSNPVIGKVQQESITAAGLALQQSGVIDANVNVAQAVAALIDTQFGAEIAKSAKLRK